MKRKATLFVVLCLAGRHDRRPTGNILSGEPIERCRRCGRVWAGSNELMFQAHPRPSSQWGDDDPWKDGR